MKKGTFVNYKNVKDQFEKEAFVNDKSIIEESILNIALQFLQNKKFRMTSVTMLSRQAGVSRSSFYRCFHNKDDVLCRLLQRELASPFTFEREIPPDIPDVLRELFIPGTEACFLENHFPGKNAREENTQVEDSQTEDLKLQQWFHVLQYNDAVLELYYTNGYSELAREQIITLFAGLPRNTRNYYKTVFLAGGILSLYEAWKTNTGPFV